MPNVLFVLEAFRRHMDDGRWLIQRGLQMAGWVAAGAGVRDGIDSTDVAAVAESTGARAVLLWPRYEWDSREWVGPEVKPEHCFTGWDQLPAEVLRVAVLHDARSAVDQQRRWLADYQPHVVLGWYHPNAVLPFWPELRAEQYERTYHVLNADVVPRVSGEGRRACLVSGAENRQVYPLRTRALAAARAGRLGPGVDAIPHPGYAQTGTHSDAYLQTLAHYKVAVCTASAYQFALRKLFEATAAGCKVITDLPEWDVLPEIDGNLVRVPPSIDEHDLAEVIQRAAAEWTLEEQANWSQRALDRYDYRCEGGRVAAALEDRARQRVA